MNKLFRTFITLFAFTALFVSASFAGITPPPGSVDCARQYRNCLKACNQAEAAAKSEKANCEKAARQQYPNGGAAYNAAIKECRDAYNADMREVATCRAQCKTVYQNCTSGNDGQQPE